jgi:hypothetical protein
MIRRRPVPGAVRTAPGRCAAVLGLLAPFLAGCASLPEAPPRMAGPTLACIRATVAAKLPLGLGDKLQHCLAGGMIARHCSTGEAWLASWGKELGDALGPGDADRRDLDAGHAGIRCARTAGDDAAIRDCCERLYPEPRTGARTVWRRSPSYRPERKAITSASTSAGLSM